MRSILIKSLLLGLALAQCSQGSARITPLNLRGFENRAQAAPRVPAGSEKPASSSAKNKQTAVLPKGIPRVHGPRDLADGIVRKVICKGPALKLSLATPEGILNLHTANYFDVRFSASNFTLKGKLNPCRQIQGMKAEAIFYDVPKHPNQGYLLSVELKK